MAVDGENDPENSQTPTAWPRCNGSPTTVLTRTDALKTCPQGLKSCTPKSAQRPDTREASQLHFSRALSLDLTSQTDSLKLCAVYVLWAWASASVRAGLGLRLGPRGPGPEACAGGPGRYLNTNPGGLADFSGFFK